MTDSGPMIYVPKVKELILPVHYSRPRMRGFFKIEARDKFTGKTRVLADWFPNLITNVGADLLGKVASGSPLGTCCVGSGNTAPAVTQTALTTLVASTTTGTNFSTSPNPTYGAPSIAPWYGSTTLTFGFNTGVAAGNLAEVGIGTSATNLFSRALILDGGGVPTTITVLSSEALFVTYQLNQYAPTTDNTGTVTIAGVVYNFTMRAMNASSASYWAYQNNDQAGIYTLSISGQVTNGALGAVTGQPSGTAAVASSYSSNAYSAGSYTQSGTISYDINHGNLSGGITCAMVMFGLQSGSRGAFQCGFSPAIPKDGSHVLTLSYSSSWAVNSP